MHRRDLLKGMLALPVAAMLGESQQKSERHYSHAPSAGFTKLCVILQGPFAVVVRKDMGYAVTAFVPALVPDDRLGEHEFRFQSPFANPESPCRGGYHLELLREGLAITHAAPHIDRGFDNVRLSVNRWTPSPGKYFVSVELPPPSAITYIPPLYPVLLESEDELGPNNGRNGGRLGSAPVNHVLEYIVRDPGHVRLRPKQDARLRPNQLQRCEIKGAKYSGDRQHPLPAQDLLQGYRDYHHSMPDQAVDPELSQRSHIDRWLAQYSHIYFLGVGLPPHEKPQTFLSESADHGARFFNEKLLPSIYVNRPIPRGTKLIKVGKDAVPCGQEQSDASYPSLRPAVWRNSMPRPHLMPVASTENCTAPGPVVTVHY